MSVLAFFKKIIGNTTIDKEELLKQLQHNERLITDIAFPSLERLGPLYSRHPVSFRHKELTRIVNTISRNNSNLTNRSGEMFVKSLKKELENVLEVLFVVQTYMRTEFPNEVTKSALNAREVAVLNTSNHIDFISRYTVTLVSYLVDKCLEAVFSGYDRTNKKTENFLIEQAAIFGKLVSVYSELKSGYVKDLSKIPDITLNVKDEGMVDVLMKGRSKVLKTSSIVSGFIGSPLYTLALWWGELKAGLYDLFENRKKQLELKLEYLESEEPSPAVEKQIKYYKEKIDDLEYRMEQMRKEAGYE